MARTIADAVARHSVSDLKPVDIYTQQLDSLAERHAYAQYLIGVNKAGLAPDALERERTDERARYAARVKHIELMRSTEKEETRARPAAAARGRPPKALRWVSRSDALADKATRERVTREVHANVICDTTNLSLRLAAARAARWECSGTKRARSGEAVTAKAKAKRCRGETEVKPAETKPAETKPAETETGVVSV